MKLIKFPRTTNTWPQTAQQLNNSTQFIERNEHKATPLKSNNNNNKKKPSPNHRALASPLANIFSFISHCA